MLKFPYNCNMDVAILDLYLLVVVATSANILTADSLAPYYHLAFT